MRNDRKTGSRKLEVGSGEVPTSQFPYRYSWGPKGLRTLDRKDQRCKVLGRGKMNSALIQFEDGFKAVVSRNALRRA